MALSFKSIGQRQQPGCTPKAAAPRPAPPRAIVAAEPIAEATLTPTAKAPPARPAVALSSKVSIEPARKRPAPPARKAKPDDSMSGSWEAQFEKKWAQAMGDADEEVEADEFAEAPGAPEEEWEDVEPEVYHAPLPKKARTQPVPDAPLTPGAAPVAKRADVRNEHPDWSDRCSIEAAKPGKPQRVTINMAEYGFSDEDFVKWCAWMDKCLVAERQGAGGKAKFKASTIDFSENKLGLVGVKALCDLLEKHGIRTEILRLTANAITNEGVKLIAKFLMSSSQALVHELHLSRNPKISSEGAKWLLGSLAIHPAYPIWNAETSRFVPLWLRIENNKITKEVGSILGSCASLRCAICLGERMGDSRCGPRQCVNVGCCDELKHNCIVHLCGMEVPDEASEQVPAPVAHAKPFFALPGRAKVKAPPSGVTECVRDEPRIVWEDENNAVVMKPANWACGPNPKGVNAAWAKQQPLARRKQVGELMTQTNAPALQGWLLLQFGADPTCDAARDQHSDRGLAHRLDVDTSGPMLIGKTMQGYEHARKQIAAGVLKDYVALVHGNFSTDRGECVAPIDTSTFAETKAVRVDPSGLAATTVWEALAEYESPDGQESYTLIHCRMVSLRTHQIRVHMQHLGHPIVGDKLYGAADRPAFCPRIFVHKLRIGFFSMDNKSCMETCSLQTAPDLWQALGRLRKTGGMAMNGCGAPGL